MHFMIAEKSRHVKVKRVCPGSLKASPGVVFHIISADFTKLFHAFVRPFFELMRYCRRELRPGEGTATTSVGPGRRLTKPLDFRLALPRLAGQSGYKLFGNCTGRSIAIPSLAGWQDILNTIPVSWITQLSRYILLADGSRRFHSLPFRILQEHPNDELRLCFRMLQAHIEIKQVPDLPSLQKGAKFRHKQFVQVIRRDVARLPVPRRFELIWYFLEIENRQIFIQIQINLQT